ncbi:MAG: DUF1343 domain-containing protein [Gemmatimonadales bacterium]|nr:DUF1343 domain-containing protein [Gemmatimonadales bacterium]
MHRSLVLLGLWGWSLGCSAPGPKAQAPEPVSVRPGIEVLLSDSMHLVRDRRVGLVTNQTGVDADGISDVVRLRTAGVRLVALFSPEHGFRGAAEPGVVVNSTVDSATGLPIYSLYGRTSAPTPEMLSGLDVILLDLQDVGARYYTWLYTTIEVMKAAGRNGVAVIVLDRPNPIEGRVQGNVLEPAFITTVGQLAIPMRHGMTLGELARLATADLTIDVDLTVVPAAGWRRSVPFDRTGLPFIPPSPNLPSLESLYHYPGTCLFEGTNLSVGRGSDAPFEQIGAPWLDTAAVLASVRDERLPGVSFRGVTFRPTRPGDGKYADTLLYGIRLEVTDRDSYDPTATAVHLLTSLRIHHGGELGWIPKHFDRLAGTAVLRESIQAGSEPEAIVRSWDSRRVRFEERRRPFLLYQERES